MTTAEIDLADPAFAVREKDRYDAAAFRHAEATDVVLTWKPIVHQAREALKALEAEMIVNGGIEGWQISGSNAEQRAASLELCKVNDDRYQEALSKLRVAERNLTAAEAAMESASHEMRGSRLMLEYAAALLNRLADQ